MTARNLWVAGAALPVALLLNTASIRATDPKEVTPAESSAPALVRAALAAEVSGTTASRNALLREATQEDPEYPPARWHAGQVRIADTWRTLEEASRQFAADARLPEYQKLREAQAGTPIDELALARWCRKHDLGDEARFHWLRLLQSQPNNEEALVALGLRWHKGRLVTIDQIEEMRRAGAKRSREAAERRLRHREYAEEREEQQKHWSDVVTRWQQAIERDGEATVGRRIRQTLQVVDASVAVPAIDVLLRQRSVAEKEQAANRALGVQWVQILAERPSATGCLIDNALWHPIVEVRQAAADSLGKRPKESYVPAMLAQMRSLIEVSFVLDTYSNGDVLFQQMLSQDGKAADQIGVRNVSLSFADRAIIAPARGGETSRMDILSEAGRRQRRANASLQFRAAAAYTALATQRGVRQFNAVAEDINARTRQALSRSTGVDLSANPKTWQKWWDDYWYDHYELQKPEGDTPVYEQTTSVSYLSNPPTSHSCFRAGTKVWTLTGATLIEQIKPGDRVLSQDPRTGELAYTTVWVVTLGKPVPLVKIGLGAESFTSTRGHPFWVVGEGWKMAKEVKAGMRLHTVSGAVSVESVEEIPAPKAWYDGCYNLLLEDFHTYFVGESRVLVHDNLIYVFDPATAPLPGWGYSGLD